MLRTHPPGPCHAGRHSSQKYRSGQSYRAAGVGKKLEREFVRFALVARSHAEDGASRLPSLPTSRHTDRAASICMCRTGSSVLATCCLLKGARKEERNNQGRQYQHCLRSKRALTVRRANTSRCSSLSSLVLLVLVVSAMPLLRLQLNLLLLTPSRTPRSAHRCSCLLHFQRVHNVDISFGNGRGSSLRPVGRRRAS